MPIIDIDAASNIEIDRLERYRLLQTPKNSKVGDIDAIVKAIISPKAQGSSRRCRPAMCPRVSPPLSKKHGSACDDSNDVHSLKMLCPRLECSICKKTLPKIWWDSDLCPACNGAVPLTMINPTMSPSIEDEADLTGSSSYQGQRARRRSTGSLTVAQYIERPQAPRSQLSAGNISRQLSIGSTASCRKPARRSGTSSSSSLTISQCIERTLSQRSRLSDGDMSERGSSCCHSDISYPGPATGRSRCERNHMLRYIDAPRDRTCDVCSARIYVGDRIAQCQLCKPVWRSCLTCAQASNSEGADANEKGQGRAENYKAEAKPLWQTRVTCQESAWKEYGDDMLGFAALADCKAGRFSHLLVQSPVDRAYVGGS